MAGMDPRRPDRHLGRRYDETSVRGFDVTCSAPKSVSVLFALGDADTRREVLAAHDAAVAALTGWIERHAHTRYRIGGEVAIVDAEGIIAAAFRQHTSRALDPQLHTHLVIPNRVASPDGRWLALDARLIKHDQRSLSAIYHAGLRAELTDRLGVAWQAPEHGIAEIRDVPDDVLAEFSTRTARCADGSTPSSTASSTPWAATRHPGSAGGSSGKRPSTAGQPRPTRSTPPSCTRAGPNRCATSATHRNTSSRTRPSRSARASGSTGTPPGSSSTTRSAP